MPQAVLVRDRLSENLYPQNNFQMVCASNTKTIALQSQRTAVDPLCVLSLPQGVRAQSAAIDREEIRIWTV